MLIFFALVVTILILKLYLNYRQSKSILRNFKNVPKDFETQITLPEHQKSASYNLAKLRLNNLEIIFDMIIITIFTLGGGIQSINDFVLSFIIDKPIIQETLIISLYTIIGAILNLPFNIYNTFIIEQKFGFNKTSFKLFINDIIKGFIVSCSIGIPFLYLILWIMHNIGNLWWIWTFIALIGFNLLMIIIYPTIIAPLFNKFKPLDDINLKDRIVILLNKCGFKSKGVYVMDGSKRSAHGNAYFTGIGSSKRIVFFDTLLNQLNANEVEAVLAHELGHFKYKHIIKQMLVSFSFSLITLFILSILINAKWFYISLGVTTINNANAIILFMMILGLIGFILKPLLSFFSRTHEFEADDFAASITNPEWLINGLVKMYRDNASTLTPDMIYVIFYYSHPPASIRISNLKKNKSAT